jgi:DNA transformation protein
MNYYSAPEDAMDSPQAMAIWARLSLEAAIEARKPKKRAPKKSTRKVRP